jgi:antirestriction protein ArdC
MAKNEQVQRDHYQEVTDRIVAALEAGAPPWRRPWDSASAGLTGPRNGTTGRRYRGVNVLLLGMHPRSFETGDPRWCSFKQAADKGWRINKGEKATTIFFFKRIGVGADGETAGEDGPETRTVPVLRAYPVFHASQIDGIEPYRPPTPEEAPWRRPDAADVIIRNSGVALRTGGDRAFYSPRTDHIQMPPDGAFVSREAWAATLLHEVGHSTGHPSRLDRDLTGRFGNRAYAMEELRAELASAFLCAELGIPADVTNHASYIDHWLAVLRQDKREIFRSAADAQRIADWVLERHPDFRAKMAVTPGGSSVAAAPLTARVVDARAPERRGADGPRLLAEAMPEHLKRRLGIAAPAEPDEPIAAPGATPVPALGP